MQLGRQKTPRVDGILGLTMVKVVKGNKYPECYASEDDCFPVGDTPYMEWADDWFDLSSKIPTNGQGQLVSPENTLTSTKEGYLVLGYGTMTSHPFGILVEEINQSGVEEVVNTYSEEVIKAYEEAFQWPSEAPEKNIAMSFGASISTDWEMGYDEAELHYLGVFDWMTGEIK